MASIRHSDVLVLARAIHDAQHVCCFGLGKEGLVMKAFASGLHHLGIHSYSMDDTNVPPFDSATLLLISAGPSSGNRVTSIMEEALSAGSRIIVFGIYPIADPQRVFTIQIPTQPPTNVRVGSDGEVMSALPDPPQDAIAASSLFDISLSLLCDCVCVMLRKAGDISPAKIRARHTNLE